MTTDADREAYAAKFYGQKEADVEKKAYEHAKSLGCWHAKFKSSNNRGVPDRIFITPDGDVFFIEFKSPKRKAKPRKQQKLVIDEMRENGAVVFVTNDLAVAKRIIEEMVTYGQSFEDQTT